ncbi:hypothetical protein OS493_003688 [Desmophyllum pertusum]|uniref:Uncharacterized protein n=1 Tax=Desmophyllum pertusum TaxID=174260 RepID=A0A9X0A6C0_9CNID|nr:hypothetical protein OS493_003688 [Desmophyllum pertusum]
MPSAKSPRSASSHSADQKLLRTKEVVIHRNYEKNNSCQCCGKRLVALPMLGFTIFSIGCLLGIGYFSIHRVTSSAYHTEGLIPSYVTGSVLGAVGLQLMLMCKPRSKILIVSSIIFTVAAGLLCFAGALYTGTEIAPLLSKMDSCQYFPVENSCKCFHQSELRQVSIIFRDTANCNGIQNKLLDLVYGMCGVYSGGLVTCILAAIMETLLLCRKRSSKATLHSRSDGDGKCTVNSRQSQTSQTDLSVIEEEDIELGAAEMQRSTIETQTSQSPSSFVREVPCSHYVVDMSIPRRDYVINYNSNSRHDPPPPYSE